MYALLSTLQVYEQYTVDDFVIHFVVNFYNCIMGVRKPCSHPVSTGNEVNN